GATSLRVNRRNDCPVGERNVCCSTGAGSLDPGRHFAFHRNVRGRIPPNPLFTSTTGSPPPCNVCRIACLAALERVTAACVCISAAASAGTNPTTHHRCDYRPTERCAHRAVAPATAQ